MDLQVLCKIPKLEIPDCTVNVTYLPVVAVLGAGLLFSALLELEALRPLDPLVLAGDSTALA